MTAQCTHVACGVDTFNVHITRAEHVLKYLHFRMMEDTLSLPTDLCLYTISIPVTLVKSGKIRLSYLFTDDRLFLQVNVSVRRSVSTLYSK